MSKTELDVYTLFLEQCQYVCKTETLCSLETFDQREILRYLSYVCLSVRSNHDCIQTQRATDFKLCN